MDEEQVSINYIVIRIYSNLIYREKLANISSLKVLIYRFLGNIHLPFSSLCKGVTKSTHYDSPMLQEVQYSVFPDLIRYYWSWSSQIQTFRAVLLGSGYLKQRSPWTIYFWTFLVQSSRSRPWGRGSNLL